MASKINWIYLIIVAFLISRNIFSACGKSMNGDMAMQASLRTARSAAAQWDNYHVSDADLIQELLDELQGSKDKPKKHKKRRKKKKKKKESRQ